MMKLGVFVTMFIVMMVFMEFIGVPTALNVTLTNFGVITNSTTSQLVSADLGNSDFWDEIFSNSGILVALATGAAAVIIGFFAKSYDTSLVIAPVIVLIGGWMISTFWILIKYVQDLPSGGDWMTKLVATVFIALGIMFIWSCVDYFAGR